MNPVKESGERKAKEELGLDDNGEKKNPVKESEERKAKEELGSDDNGENKNPVKESEERNAKEELVSDDNGENKNPVKESEQRMAKASPLPPRLRRLRAAQFLPRDEILGGYIFICDNATMVESYRRRIFGVSAYFEVSVRRIRPGTPLFLFNNDGRLLYGGFEATSNGAMNIDPLAWPDPDPDPAYPGRSLYPAQVRIQQTNLWPPLPYSIFKVIAPFHDHRFRRQLTMAEASRIISTFKHLDWYCTALAQGLETGRVMFA